jgi:sigma-B regulation protein RsbU (phosphoserine phosphatase)
MPAALLMSNLQAAIRSAAVQTTDPAELAARVRHVVTPNLTGGRFVPFCLLSVDATRTTLSWANLGHEPPILVRADGTVVHLSATGPAVARLLSGLPVSADRVPVSPGDRLVMWTDGVSEALDADGRPFGRDRVERVITDGPRPAAAMVESITDAVRQHTGGTFQDDVTVMAVVVTGDRG